MRIKFLKSIASIYGGFAPGMVVDIPNEAVARSWCNAGIAKPDKGKPTGTARQTIKAKVPKEKPEKIPKGQFWCPRHQTLHRLNSPTGMKCHKRLVEAEEKAEQERAAQAERERIEQEEAASPS